MTRRACRLGISLIASLVIFGVIALPCALAATSSWEWESSAEYPGEIGDFGQTPAGGGPTEPHEYVLANTGEAPITIERFIFGVQTSSEPHRWTISHNECKKGSTIEPGQTCSVDVIFEPLSAGWKLGRLRVEAVGGEPPEARVEYEGHAVGPWVEPEPHRLEFGSVQMGSGPSPVQTITVTNGESVPLHIYGTSVTDIYDQPEFPSPFRVVGGTCQEGVVVTTLGSCTVEVVLEPSQAASLESKLWISDSAEGAQSVLLRGVGTAPPVEPPTITTSEPENHGSSPLQAEVASAKGSVGESPTSPPAAVPSTPAPKPRTTEACLKDKRTVRDLKKRLNKARSPKQRSAIQRSLRAARTTSGRTCRVAHPILRAPSRRVRHLKRRRSPHGS
jgi:hypothetical protein